MAASGVLATNLSDFNRYGLGAPLLVMVILSMMVVPLSPFVLDMLFTFNISLALVVLLAVVYSRRPLEFAAFPTVLLIATLLRLSLNVASTRVVLLNGHNGTAAAGKVIEAFGEFVIGGNYTVGFVVFMILIIINFVVVTKGAGRISEVSARFTLDALPGKQMAIDADLNAGLINQEQALKRRSEVGQEADFYGSMDGASKFVRGDAVAGILVLLINIIGGLAIGIVQHGLSVVDAARLYTLLTIGDGLVAQIPALLLSTAAAIIVTRVSAEHDMGQQILSQLFQDNRSLAVTAGVIGALGLIPGMPNIAFLLLAVAAGAAAWWRSQRARQVELAKQEQLAPPPPAVPEERELSWDDVSVVDQIGLEVGYRLIPMVDRQQGGQLLARIKGVRKKLTQELGFLLPTIHIRDNLDIEPNHYRITIKDTTVARAAVHPDQELAINPGQVFGQLQGAVAKDPVFGLEAVWVDAGQHDQARTYGYTVVDASTVIATHMSQVLQDHAHELLGHREVQELLERFSQKTPKVIEEVIPKLLPLGIVVRVMRNLLRENIPIRDVRTIIETLVDHAPRTQDIEALTGVVRIALGRLIIERIVGPDEDIPVITLDMALEQILQQSMQTMAEGGGVIEPGLAQRMMHSLKDYADRQEVNGQAAIILVPDNLREMLVRMAKHSVPRLNVLAFSEVPAHRQIKIVATVGNQK